MWLYLFHSVFKLYHPILYEYAQPAENSFIHIFKGILKIIVASDYIYL